MATLFNTKIKDTYQSLLKLEDNTILTTTTKNVTDGLGNASPLYMSTTRVGIGTNAPVSTLNVLGLSTFIGASGSTLGSTTAGAAAQFYQNGFSALLAIGGFANNGAELQTYTNGGITLGGTNIYLQRQSGNVLIGGTTGAGKLTVQGTGSSSATTSFLVQNSSGQQSLAVTDDGKLYVGFSGAGSIGGIYVPFDFPGYGARNFLFNSSGNAMMKTISNDEMGFNLNCYFDRAVGIAGNFLTGLNMTTHVNAANSTASLIRNSGTNWSTQSNGTCIGINLQPVIDTDASSGSAKYIGFYWNPNIADLQSARHNAIETVTGNVLLGTTSGNVGIGTSNPTEKLDIVGNIKSLGTLNITIPAVNTLANGSIIAAPSQHGRPYAVDFTIGAYTLTTQDNQLTIGPRNSGVMFIGSQMYTYGIPTQIWGTSTGPNNCSSLHIGVNSTSEYQTGTAYPSTSDNYFYLSTVIVAPNGSIYSPTRPTPTRRKFIFSALELLFHTGDSGVEAGRIFSNGNWAINTTTNAGYKLDVNGSTRSQGNLTVGNGTSGNEYNLIFNAAFPGAGTRGGIVWISGASILNRRKYSGGNDNTISFVVANNTLELLTIQEHNGTTTTNNVGINNSSPHVSAVLDVASTTKGFLPPRMLQTERTAITSPAIGLMVYQTDMVEGIYVYKSTGWTFVA
jgi:hypothetical protein